MNKKISLEEKIVSRQQEIENATQERERMEKEREYIEIDVNPELIEKLESISADVQELKVSHKSTSFVQVCDAFHCVFCITQDIP